MEKPLKLFLGNNTNYVPVSLDKKLDEISQIPLINGFDLHGIVNSLEKENSGNSNPIIFELKLYGATVGLKQQVPFVTGNYLPSVEGKELVKGIQEFFDQATSYALKHNSRFVLIQNLSINLAHSRYNPSAYKLKGLVQLFLL